MNKILKILQNQNPKIKIVQIVLNNKKKTNANDSKSLKFLKWYQIFKIIANVAKSIKTNKCYRIFKIQ